MNETIRQFKKEQEKNQQSLEKLFNFINNGEEFGISIENSFKEKIANAIANLSNQKLKVALIGGFSEGKTSIAAAWIERLDKNNMKIDHQESSDEVQIYNIDDEIELVDTPGLFGFKEKKVDDGKIEHYKDITKKYISEAHLILYVLNPANPIKESHKDDLIWLFRTLNLLPRTVFVISRFDEEADIEDEEDYNKKFKIKKENIQNRLEELIGLSKEEKEDLSIVAVAANPFDSGIEYWLANMEEFKRLSHIESLQSQTQKKIQENGGKLSIIEEAKKSIIQDVFHKQLPLIQKEQQESEENINKLEKIAQKMRQDTQKMELDISQARINLREFAVGYFSDLCSQVSGLSMETFNDFVEREIGNEGINIEAKVQNEFERQTQGILNHISKIETNFNTEISLFQKGLTTLGKQGVGFLAKSQIINPNNIKLGRDVAVSVAKFVGIDLALKFKPWGAIKLAGNINKALPLIGIGLELWDSWSEQQRRNEVEKAKVEMKANFEKQKKEILDLVNDEKAFKEKCFSGAIELEKSLQEIEEGIKKEQERSLEFTKWVKTGEEIIEVEIL